MTIIDRPRGVTRRCVSALCLTLLGGCSLFNPHVESTVPRPAFKADGQAIWSDETEAQNRFAKRCAVDASSTPRFAGGIGEAVCFVNGYREAYHDAVGNDSLLRTVTGTALIPLSAAALYLGLTTNDSTKAIAALALSGASLFGVASFLQSTPRQRVYLAGSQAMGCTLLAMRPFMMPESEYATLSNNLNELYQQTNITSDLRNRVKREVPSTDAAATAAIAAADEMIAEARQVHTAGARLRREMATAGFTLTVAADNIADKVDDLLVQTEPDLTSLLGITSNLGTTATALAPGPLGRRTTTDFSGLPREEREQTVRERTLVDQLRDETALLRTAIDQVGMTLTEIAATASLRSSIEGCEVESPTVSLVVTPGDPQQTMPAGATKRFAVSGGSGVPRAAFVGDTIKGAELKPGIQNGVAVFDLVTTTEGGPGTLGIAFSDAAGQGRTVITVTVETGEEPAPEGNAARSVVAECPLRTREGLEQGPALPEPLSQDEADLARRKGEVEVIQRALNRELGLSLAIDGVIGRETLLAVGAYQERTGKPRDFCLSKVLATELARAP